MIDLNRHLREFGALALFFCCALVVVSLATHSPQDPSFTQHLSPGFTYDNAAGVVGAHLSGFLLEAFGLVAWFVPLMLLTAGAGLMHPRLRLATRRWVGILLFFFCLLGLMASSWGQGLRMNGVSGGGLLGTALYSLAVSYLHITGALLVWLFLLLVGFQLLVGHSWPGALSRIRELPAAIRVPRLGFPRLWPPFRRTASSESAPAPPSKAAAKPAKKKEASDSRDKSGAGSRTNKASSGASPSGGNKRKKGNYPGPELLAPVPEKGSPADAAELEDLSSRLRSCLLDFGIKGELINVQPGPVVTMFEFKPAPGIKIRRIANLSDDLALALKAYAVRIVAPIPGKDMVGIEVPNRKRQTVYFREIVESDAFIRSKASLPMALGHTIEDQPRVEDLTDMPHLLVAGATGTGKSVCLNGIIQSLLFKASPEEVNLLLIDPKRIELAVYDDLPHLVHPVVTEMDLAKAALDWALHEMERRYQAMASLSVRNIASYNRKLENQRQKDPQSVEGLQRIPYLVIIIDELADLMLTAGKEAESCIVRLAQLARAAGIHIILATQRPSVDVVTGLIKANFPARIAFQVSSRHDSRTILDSGGAEYLLGKGDLLFKSTAGRLERMHGPFLSDEEISSLLDFWRQWSSEPRAEVDLEQWKNKTGSSGPGSEDEDVTNDPLYDQAVNFVLEQGKASISMIQRQLRIGFNRAARYVEQMEQDGIVGPQEGSKPRMVNRG
ncbi:MAG: DNA translocase FtsK 4TM domain-containing protein [Desulfohalobiaceae bacterium]|nr:DNA translocase FtsK 4TM domain-containing protein [Desulfohalobiaceae bacterium]